MAIIRAKSPEPCPKHNHQSNLGELPKWLWLSVLENSKNFNQSRKMRKQDTFLFFQFFSGPTLNVFLMFLDAEKTFLTWHQAIEGWQLLGREWKHVMRDAPGCRGFLKIWMLFGALNLQHSCTIMFHISHHLRHKLTTIHNTHPKHLTVPKQPMNQQVPTLHWWTKKLILDFCVLISGAGAFFFNLSGGPKWPVLFIGKDLVVFGRRSG